MADPRVRAWIDLASAAQGTLYQLSDITIREFIADSRKTRRYTAKEDTVAPNDAQRFFYFQRFKVPKSGVVTWKRYRQVVAWSTWRWVNNGVYHLLRWEQQRRRVQREFGPLAAIDLRIARASVGIVRLNGRMYATSIDAVCDLTTVVVDSVMAHRPRNRNWLEWLNEVEKENPSWFKTKTLQHELDLCDLAMQFEAANLLPDEDGFRAIAKPAIAERPTMTLQLAEPAVRECLLNAPNSSIRDVAGRVGCSVGLVAKTLAWKACQARHREGRGAKRDAVSLDTGLHATVGRLDPELVRLIGEQAADARNHRRRSQA